MVHCNSTVPSMLYSIGFASGVLFLTIAKLIADPPRQGVVDSINQFRWLCRR